MDFDWDQVRNSGIAPTTSSTMDETPALRAEFIRGAELLRLHGDRATLDPFTKRPKRLHPQQLAFADVVNAGARFTSGLWPRRSAKTSSFFALAVGRCSSREGYLASYTMLTTAIKSRERFRRDLAMQLEALYPDKKDRSFKISYAGGYERVEWDNGSLFAFLAPRGESFRSDAWDLIGLDEGGEADPETTQDVLAGVLATGDTRPDSQIVIEGTAAKYRTGNILWDELEEGRSGIEGHAIIDYSAPAGVTGEDVDTWEKAVPLLVAHHPGIGTLTRLDMLKGNYDKQDPEDFAREYLGVFGTGGAAGGIFNMRQWAAGKIDGDKPEPPAKVALAIGVHPNQNSAVIVAAWREDEKPRVLVIDYRERVEWLVKAAHALAVRRKAPIAHDTAGPVTAEVEALARLAPRVKLIPQSFPNVKTAAATIVKEVEMGNVGHWDQAVLNEAVRLARKRSSSRYSGWALGRGEDDDDIIAIETAALALRAYDDMRERPSLTPFVAE